MTEVNRTEKTIIEALGDTTFTIEELAIKADYQVSGCFRRTLSSLRKRGILPSNK